MIRPVLPAFACPPQNRCKRNRRQQKENTDDFQQNLATDCLERLEESRNSVSYITSDLARSASSFLSGRSCALLNVRRRALRTFAHDRLASHTARQAKSNPKHPSNRLRSHFDMMVAAADVSSPLCIQC